MAQMVSASIKTGKLQNHWFVIGANAAGCNQCMVPFHTEIGETICDPVEWMKIDPHVGWGARWHLAADFGVPSGISLVLDCVLICRHNGHQTLM